MVPWLDGTRKNWILQPFSLFYFPRGHPKRDFINYFYYSWTLKVMTHAKIKRILAQGMRCRFLPLNTLQKCSTDSAYQVWRQRSGGKGCSSGLKQPTGLRTVSQVTHWVSLLAHKKGWEIKGTKHEQSNMLREFQGRVGVEMTGRAGDGRQTDLYRFILCLVSNARPLMIFKESDAVKDGGQAGRRQIA